MCNWLACRGVKDSCGLIDHGDLVGCSRFIELCWLNKLHDVVGLYDLIAFGDIIGGFAGLGNRLDLYPLCYVSGSHG